MSAGERICACSCGSATAHVIATRTTLAGEAVRLRHGGHIEDAQTNLSLGCVPESVQWVALDVLQWVGTKRAVDVVRAAKQTARSRFANGDVAEMREAMFRALDTGSVLGRMVERCDRQHILHCRDPWCRVCRQGSAVRGGQ